MKKMKIVSLIVFLCMILAVGTSCKKKGNVSVNNPPGSEVGFNTEQVDEGEYVEEVGVHEWIEEEESLLGPEQYPSYEIVKTVTTLREDKGETLFVLVPPVDLELRNHVVQTKNLIKKLVVIQKRAENISILVFDDLTALEKVFENPNTEDLNVPAHYLARYDGSPANGVYQYTLVIFPIAPESNPAIQSQTDTIEFNPYEW